MNYLITTLKILLKTILLLGLVFAVLLYTGNLDKLKTYTTNSFNFLSLVTQAPPEPNSLPNPIPDAHLTDTWGAARSGGRKHEGIDIFAERGTPIYSTTNGIVRKVGTDRLGGNVVSILGPGRVVHYYAHLESFADIAKGDWVEAGDIIGYVGTSGNAQGTPPHVHYGVYNTSGAENPYPLLKK